MLSHIHAVNYATSHKMQSWYKRKVKFINNSQSIQRSVRNKKQPAMPTVVAINDDIMPEFLLSSEAVMSDELTLVMSSVQLLLQVHNVHTNYPDTSVSGNGHSFSFPLSYQSQSNFPAHAFS